MTRFVLLAAIGENQTGRAAWQEVDSILARNHHQASAYFEDAHPHIFIYHTRVITPTVHQVPAHHCP